MRIHILVKQCKHIRTHILTRRSVGYTHNVKKNSNTYHEPVRRPAHKTLEKLLDAAEEQLREEELDLFTIQRVLERAGLSVGAFYSRFPSKTALLQTVQERVRSRLDSAIRQELEAQAHVDETLEQAVDHALGIITHRVLEERALSRAFMMLSAFDPVMRERSEQGNQATKTALFAVLAAHRDEIGHPDPDAAIDLAYAIFSAEMGGRLVPFDPHSALHAGTTDEQVFDQVKRSLASYLRGDKPAD